MAGYRTLGRGGSGSGVGPVTIGPEFGSPAPHVIVTASVPAISVIYSTPHVVVTPTLPAITVIYSNPQAVAAAFELGFTQTITLGANAAAVNDGVGTNWQNINNATGKHDGTNSTFSGDAVQARSGTITLDYANIAANHDIAEAIDTVTLKYYIKSAGTTLNNGDLRARWRRVSTDAWTDLETITGDKDATGTPDSFVVTTSIRDWADIDTLQAGVFGATDVGEALVNYSADAVELVVTSHRVAHVNDPRNVGTNLKLWLDADNLNTTRQTNADTTPSRTNNDNVKRWKDISGNGINLDYPGTGTVNLLKLADLNGRPGIASGSLSASITAATTEATVFLVYTNFNGAAEHLRGNTSNTATRAFVDIRGRGGSSGSRFRYVDDSGVQKEVVLTSSDAAGIACIRIKSSGLECWYNGVSKGTDAGYTLAAFNEFATAGTGFERYYEAIVWFSALSDADRRKIERYLGMKWGISVP